MKKTSLLVLAGALVTFVAVAAPARAEDYPEKAECENAIGYIKSNGVACKAEADAIARPNVSCESRSKAQHVFAKYASCRKKVTGS